MRFDLQTLQPPATEAALLLLLAGLWGASYTLIKVGVETIPPLTLIAARTLMAGGILLVLLRSSGHALPKEPAAWRRFLLQACLNSVVPFTLIAWAEREVDASLATILNAASPVFAFLLAGLGCRQRATRRQLFGVVCGLAGICVIVGPRALHQFGHQLAAQLALVAATICYAGAAVFGRNFSALNPMVPAAGSLLCGAAIMVPLSLVVDRPWTLAPSPRSALALVALSIFCTALALAIYFRLVRTLGSVGATAQAYLRVPVGVACAVLFLGESLSPGAWIGLACTVAGVAAMSWPGTG